MEKEIVLLQSKDFYSGYNMEEDCYTIDSISNLMDNPDIDENSISWHEDSFNEGLDYFNSFVSSLKNAYEKRYRTKVMELALIGRVGRWNGSCSAGAIRAFGDIIPSGWDDFELSVDEGGYLFVRGHHHDGSDWMLFYFLTESNMKKAGVFHKYDYYGVDSFDCEDFEKLSDVLNPVKVPVSNGYYRIK